ncbi:putative phosphate transport regulator [Sulfobacillus acidophilus TPY]|jgi:predicted phosphate transport protein (TIGR00153 family)|uniref:Phosphate transport regulator n=1 Tax=Sulfobacillus acidophilus (strain ATCC 700253 / DSM 10332 / NAL) TaxID=679936 RepID=G8TZK7_SULAD|nr:putative phosphate transport regulator [Sulfobacillus acidophilus TPY]AEW05247.1 putative phosphate transport regulator [Sulfobacillus acidophilus DSM 10332]
MRWRDLLTGTDDGFHQLLNRQLAETETMVRLVLAYIESPDAEERARLAQEAGEVEHRADAVRQELAARLSQTFVTPFDREDINELSRAIDDIADYAENTIKEIQLYRVEPDSFIHDMVQTLLEAVEALQEAVLALGQQPGVSNQAALRAKSLENKMEGLYRKAIAHFSETTEVHYLIKMREVYRHLSNAADRVDLAANVINSIVVKQNL